MLFSDLKDIVNNQKIIGKLPKKKIKYISDHSKNVDGNTLLIINKKKNFKLSYLKEAISKNLNTIITNSFLKNCSLNQIIVKDLEKEISRLIKFRQPFLPKISVAITGTNGKTSTSWYLAQICKINRIPLKLTGTLGYFIDLKKYKDSVLTTPSNLDLYQFASESKKNKFCFITEASSHGLHQGRFNNFNIDIAAITNLSHDHLDYHKNFSSYINSKFLLFTKILNTKGVAVINSRLKNYRSLEKKIKERKIKIITFGSKDVFFYKNNNLYLYIFGKKYNLTKFQLINNIQKENLECAIACALAMNISINKIINCLHKLKSAPGRFEMINFRQKNSKIIIDYAHTPDALENILKTFSYDNFKPSLVFGCGGNRDKEKRKKMAILAKKYANRVYITDDNPRYENPKIIRESIKKYCPKGVEISNRRKAIHKAIFKLDVNDILIIAGKGHEKYQLIKNKKIEFNDYKIAKNFIK
jgi:UDP-N-acetylmuramyl-tripeptide synthetase